MSTDKKDPSSLNKKIVYVKDLKGSTHAVSFTHVSTVHPALREYFCYCLLKVSNQTKIDLDQALAPFQFQTVHFAILSIIEKGNGPVQNEVGEQMGIDKASMVKLIDHLESLKLVERISGSEDRRCKLLHLTPHGKTIMVKAKKAAELAEAEFLKALSPEEQAVLKKLIPRLLP